MPVPDKRKLIAAISFARQSLDGDVPAGPAALRSAAASFAQTLHDAGPEAVEATEQGLRQALVMEPFAVALGGALDMGKALLKRFMNSEHAAGKRAAALGVALPVPRGMLWKMVMDAAVPFSAEVQGLDAPSMRGKVFSYEEPGYVSGLLDGLALVFGGGRAELHAGGLKDLHRLALQHRPESSPGAFRVERAAFRPGGAWADLALRKALAQEINERYAAGGAPCSTGPVDPSRPDGPWEVVAHLCGDEALTACVDAVFAQCYQRLEAAGGDAASSRRVIADTCHQLALIHPFNDGNGRTIGALVLNKLLMDAGLPPWQPSPSVCVLDFPVDRLDAQISAGQRDLAEAVLQARPVAAAPMLDAPFLAGSGFMSTQSLPLSPGRTLSSGSRSSFPGPHSFCTGSSSPGVAPS